MSGSKLTIAAISIDPKLEFVWEGLLDEEEVCRRTMVPAHLFDRKPSNRDGVAVKERDHDAT